MSAGSGDMPRGAAGYSKLSLGMLLLLIVVLSIAGVWVVYAITNSLAPAPDWPTYMHDPARSGVTPTTVTLPVGEQWVYRPPGPPRPAWPDPQPVPVEGNLELPRMKFDDAFHVAVADGAVYFGSSADNKVYSLDAGTGRVRWQFFTGGPVRLAPAVHNGRVYVGSDDGYVYCLSAADGRLIWKFHAAPNGKRVLGRGKMISLWPVRTGVVADGGIAYFACGVFPGERVYVYAVRAQDGSLLWKNDTVSDLKAGQNGFSPQGYLLLNKTYLFIPSGRAMPACFDRQDGRFIHQRKFSWRSIGIIGGTYALLSDDHLYSGTLRQVVTLDKKSGNVGFAWFPGRRLVLTAKTSYMLNDAGITALDRAAYVQASRTQRQLTGKRTALKRAKPGDLTEQLRPPGLRAGQAHRPYDLRYRTGRQEGGGCPACPRCCRALWHEGLCRSRRAGFPALLGLFRQSDRFRGGAGIGPVERLRSGSHPRA